VDDNQRTALSDGALPRLIVSLSGAAGLMSCSDIFDTPRRSDLDVWSKALNQWSRDIDVYGVVVRAWQSERPTHSPAHGTPLALADDLRALFQLIWQQDCFVKPTVSLMNAAQSAPAMALALAGTHRVAGPRFTFATPPPDVVATMWGLASFYAAMPSALGRYLALTGVSVGWADAHRLGLVTHCIDDRHFDAITAGIEAADPVDPLVDDLHQDRGGGELFQREEPIARCFSAASVLDIISHLDNETGIHKAFAQKTKTTLAQFPLAAMDDRLQLLRRAAEFDLRAALIDDFAHFCQASDMPLELVSRASLQAPRT
jgi:enoyl-CoA hydratase/carnithine racemase